MSWNRGAEVARDRALSQATSHDPYFVKRRAPAGQFVGRSTSSLEEAIDDALSKADPEAVDGLSEADREMTARVGDTRGDETG